MDRRAPTAAATAPPLATPDRGLGERVRRLRNACGLTQTELAEARVSKEYISQIETGKTRPTSQTLEWLADRLGVDTHFLADGVSDRDHREHEALVSEAEDAVHEKRYGDAVDLIGGLSRTPAPSRLGGGAGGHRPRARARRGAERRGDDRARPLPGFARRRAERQLGAGAHVLGAGEGALRGRRRSRERRPAPEQPRLPELPPRAQGAGRRAAQGRVPHRARGGRSRRRRAGCVLARRRAPAERRARAGGA